jgi:hypothetical protein
MAKVRVAKSVKSEADLNKLRINIDKKWTAHDFAILFRSLDSLYGMYAQYIEGLEIFKEKKKTKIYFANERHTPSFHFLATRSLIRSFFSEEGVYQEYGTNDYFLHNRLHSGLTISSVSYSSPGFTDIVGLSGALGQLKEILIHYFPNKMTKEEIRIKEQNRISLQIQNLKDMGFSSVEIKKIILLEEITLEKLKLLIDEGKITSLDMNEN